MLKIYLLPAQCQYLREPAACKKQKTECRYHTWQLDLRPLRLA